MLRDFKIGLAVWKRTANLKWIIMRTVLLAAAGAAAGTIVAPRLYGRARAFASPRGIDGGWLLMTWALLCAAVFLLFMKRIVYEACDGNRDLFYQLAIGRRAGCICTLLQQFHWYGCLLVMLLAVCGGLPVTGRFLAAALGAGCAAASAVCCNKAFSRMGGGPEIGFRRKFPFRGIALPGVPHIFRGAFRRDVSGRPVWGLFGITYSGFWKCGGLAAGKVLLLAFVICCGAFHVLSESNFLLAAAFLILLNDGYWRNESRNFRYFSRMGFPVSRYIWIHFLAGLCFNTALPLLLFLVISGRAVPAAVIFVLLSYLLIYWYLVQMYLYLAVGREREAAMMLLGMAFLAAAALPPAGLAVMVRLYKGIVRKWREQG